MSLTRDDLENDRLRKLFCQANPSVRVLSSEQLDASLMGLLAEHPGGDVWLFGYGSLIWNPCIHFEERHVAKLHGYHRSFCIWSHVGRGSMQKPGLVLGLDRGGSCRGVVFRIRGDLAAAELRLIWRREMVLGSYCPRWVGVTLPDRELSAIAFTVNRGHSGYAGRLPLETVIKTMMNAHGYLGTPVEYLMRTTRGLLEHGIRDNYLLELRKRVITMHPEMAHAAKLR